MDEESKGRGIEDIVRLMTRELYSHDYIIGRREAKDVIKLKVTNATDQLEKQLWSCFSAYSDALQLNAPYNPAIALGPDQERDIELDGAFIESTTDGFAFKTKKHVSRLMPGQVPGVPTATGFQEQILDMGWTKV
jgi:hypothetical protein